MARRALSWIEFSQDKVGTGGVGCYEFYRWTKGYPEVTGYIIPTFWDSYHLYGEDSFHQRVIRMADWEVSIQNPNGGWEGFYEGDGQPTVVFNTGQVLRGLIRTYKETRDEKYLKSAIRGADWIVQNQDPDGSWTTSNFKKMKRVYDTYVSAPLASLYAITGDSDYKNAALRNCEFAIAHQRKNGWFDLFDNTIYNNEAPVTHTLSYTIDGLIETGDILGEKSLIQAGTLAADAMMHKAEILPFLPGRLDHNWKKRANYVCNTGCAQLGIILMRLYDMSNDARYLNCSLKLADFLGYIQALNSVGKDRRGGISGSYPVWGFYCPLKYPSWASKYYIDLLHRIARYVKQR